MPENEIEPTKKRPVVNLNGETFRCPVCHSVLKGLVKPKPPGESCCYDYAIIEARRWIRAHRGV